MGVLRGTAVLRVSFTPPTCRLRVLFAIGEVRVPSWSFLAFVRRFVRKQALTGVVVTGVLSCAPLLGLQVFGYLPLCFS